MLRIYCLLLVVLLLQSCDKLKEFEFRNVESWQVQNMGISSSNILSQLRLHNPNKFTLTLKHIEGNVFMENIDQGSIFLDTTIRIPSQQDFILPLQLQLKTANILMNAFNYFMGDSVLIKLKGRMKVGHSGFFIRYPFDNEIKIPKPF